MTQADSDDFDTSSHPPEPAAVAPIDDLGAVLARIEQGIADFHERSAAREAIIDRLHADNEAMRNNLQRLVLDPVVTDLVRLFDDLTRAGLTDWAEQTQLILERCGIESFDAGVGDAYEPGRHRPVRAVPTSDPAHDNTIAKVLAVGFVDRESQRVRRPVLAEFFRYDTEPIPDNEGASP